MQLLRDQVVLKQWVRDGSGALHCIFRQTHTMEISTFVHGFFSFCSLKMGSPATGGIMGLDPPILTRRDALAPRRAKSGGEG